MMGSPITSSNAHYEWFFYAEGYLGLAKIGCQELFQQHYRGKSTLDDLLYGHEVFKSRLLLIPIFFNIRHSLELFIKGLGVSLDKKYWNEHDIDFLLKDFAGRLKGFPGLKSDQKLSVRIDKVKPVIRRYFRCEFLKSINGVRDFQNELFRYPESKDPSLAKLTNFKRSPNIFEELGMFNRSDLQRILDDVRDIHEVFALVRVRLGAIKLGFK